jgi:hypothetical protein
MAYGQKNYLELQGISGKYRISQIGCFITAFCNLLDRFGKGVGSPVEMNRILRDNGFYVDVDDGVRDDVGYSTVSKVNGNIVVSRTGKGLPPSNNCIVKFSGLSGFGTHFCLVSDASRGLIIDSWDGVEKHWSTYNDPDEWAEYVDNSPVAAAAPAPSAPADSIVVQAGWGISHVAQAAGYADWASVSRWDYLARINGHADHSTFRLSPNQVVKVRGADPAEQAPAAPQSNSQPVSAPAEPEVVNITVQPGWGITHVLKAAGYSQEQYEREAEWDRVAALNGSASRLRLQPGQSVKVYRNPLPAVQAAAPVETPAPAVIETPQAVTPVVDPPKQAEEIQENEDGSVIVPVTVVPKDPNAYKKTLVPENKVYIAATSKTIKDMDGLGMDLQLVAGQKVTSGGSFEREETVDGKKVTVKYVITAKHLSENKWYGINKDFLGAAKDPNAYVGPLVKDEDDDVLKNLLDPDFIAETKEAIGKFTHREKFIDSLGVIFDAVAKLRFWDRTKKH